MNKDIIFTEPINMTITCQQHYQIERELNKYAPDGLEPEDEFINTLQESFMVQIYIIQSKIIFPEERDRDIHDMFLDMTCSAVLSQFSYLWGFWTYIRSIKRGTISAEAFGKLVSLFWSDVRLFYNAVEDASNNASQGQSTSGAVEW